MLGAAAVAALLWAMAFPVHATASDDPISYAEAVAADRAAATAAPETTASGTEGSDSGMTLTDEQRTHMEADPRWSARVNLYHAGGGGATGNDSLGCRPIAMRTVAVDPRYIPRRTRLFIPETVGIRLPDGTIHDGYWYASDTGGAIKGQKIDLYTGHGRGSMQPAMRFNQRRVTIVDAGRFEGCPPSWDSRPTLMARSSMAAVGSN